QEKLADARAGGMAAFQAGDYRAALNALKTYVSREHNDVDALYAYALSRAKVEEPNGKNITEGITALNALLQIEPHHLRAKHDLLDLYVRAYYNAEAADLAERILNEAPDDRQAMRCRCVALDRLRKYEPALALS